MFGLVTMLIAIISALGTLIPACALRRYVKKWIGKRIRPESYPRVAVIAPQRGEINPR